MCITPKNDINDAKGCAHKHGVRRRLITVTFSPPQHLLERIFSSRIIFPRPVMNRLYIGELRLRSASRISGFSLFNTFIAFFLLLLLPYCGALPLRDCQFGLRFVAHIFSFFASALCFFYCGLTFGFLIFLISGSVYSLVLRLRLFSLGYSKLGANRILHILGWFCWRACFSLLAATSS